MEDRQDLGMAPASRSKELARLTGMQEEMVALFL